MAVDVLMHEMHKRKHDLESFYWLFIWTLLRHADHNQEPSRYSKLFDIEDREHAASMKRTWLATSNLSIYHNNPLTQLLERLRDIFDAQLGSLRLPSKEITYDTLLAGLDNALAQPGWPANDSSTVTASLN
jgi:hypothetical protein